MNVHRPIADEISVNGKQVLLRHRHIADCANEQTAEWIARALVLQSHSWAEGEPRRAMRRSFARGALVGLAFEALLIVLMVIAWEVFA